MRTEAPATTSKRTPNSTSIGKDDLEPVTGIPAKAEVPPVVLKLRISPVPGHCLAGSYSSGLGDGESGVRE